MHDGTVEVKRDSNLSPLIPDKKQKFKTVRYVEHIRTVFLRRRGCC